MTECAVADCEEVAAVRLHVPWEKDRDVCVGHARTLATREGVVAEPIDNAIGEWS